MSPAAREENDGRPCHSTTGSLRLLCSSWAPGSALSTFHGFMLNPHNAFLGTIPHPCYFTIPYRPSAKWFRPYLHMEKR